MPRPLTSTQNDIASAMLAAGMTQKDIAPAVGCYIGHVKLIKPNLHYWGTPRPPILGRHGQAHSLTVGHVDIHVFRPFC